MGITSISPPNNITFFFFFLLLLAFSLPTSSITITSTTSTNDAKYPGRFSKIFAFGDSFTDTGNTQSSTGPLSFGYVSNPPYGTTFFHHSTNRYSDGRLVIDFLADTLSLPFLSPFLNRKADFSNGVNFAVAGSTAIDHDFFVKNNISLDITPQSLQTQLQWFNQYLEGKGCRGVESPECIKEMEDALLWVGEIGVNDFAYSVGSSLSPATIRSLAIQNVHSFLQALLSKGAKYIVVQGQPLIGCLPLSMILAPVDDRDALGCSASANNHSHAYNSLLQAKLSELKSQYPKAIISYADYFSAHHAVMKNPTTYGFSEPFKACCGSGGGSYNFDLFATCGSPQVNKACAEPKKYLNWDGVHLTEAMYNTVANLFFNDGYCRPSFNSLVSSKQRQGGVS